MENIQVALRIRPLNKKEVSRNDEDVWDIPKSDTITLANRDYYVLKKSSCIGRTTFYFDQCFSPENDNVQVYQQIVKRVVMSSLNGINGTIFMYGQTGSGKTYTMMGYNKHEDEDNNTSSGQQDKCESPRNNRSSTPPMRANKRSYSSAGKFYESVGNQQKEQQQNNNPNPQNGPANGNYIITEMTGSTGILIIALKDIFETVEKDMDKTYFLRCSYVEIYNDQIFDLLQTSERLGETLTVNEDPNKDFYIKGVTEESVSSIEEILDKLRKGEANRHYARTTMNHTSSRSHTIFRLTVQSVTNNFIREYRREMSKCSTNINNLELKNQKFNDQEETEGTIVTESMLNFVDLAGSEKVSNHQMLLDEAGVTGVDQGGIYGRDSIMAVNKVKDRIKEGQHINKSLFFLTQVISLKSEGKSNQHIPYRNSPLTKILRSSLGGNSRTLIILCMTPAATQFEQSMSTLRFGMNAKKIENKVQANIVTRDDDVGLKILIADYEKKLKDLEGARLEEQSKCSIYLKQIEELQAQKNVLVERVNSLAKSRMNRMIESVQEPELMSFYKEVKNRCVHLDKIGVIFPSQDLNKYDSILRTSMEYYESNVRKYKHAEQEEPEEEEEERIEYEEEAIAPTDYASIKKEIQQQTASISKKKKKGSKMEQSLCKLYAKLLKGFKEENVLLLKKIEILEKNGQALIERDLVNYDSYRAVLARGESDKRKLNEVSEKFKDQGKILRGLEKDTDLYRDLKGMKNMEDEDLEDLEKHFWEKLDTIKRERARREIRKEMGLPQEREQESQEATVIEVSFASEEGENADWENQGREEEENLLKEIMKRGLENLEQELEGQKRKLLETKDIVVEEKENVMIAPMESPKILLNTPNTQQKRSALKTIATEKSANRTERDSYRSPTQARTPVKKLASCFSAEKTMTPQIQSERKMMNTPQTEQVPRLDLLASITSFVAEPSPVKVISTRNAVQTTPLSVLKGNNEELTSQRRGRSETKPVLSSSASAKKEEPSDPFRHLKGSSQKHESRNEASTMASLTVEKEKEKSKSPLRESQNLKVNSSGTNSEKSVVYDGVTYSSYKKDLSHLQNQLTKHLASLEKYFTKPASSMRKTKEEDRSRRVSIAQSGDGIFTPSEIKQGKEEKGKRNRRFEEEFELDESRDMGQKRKVLDRKGSVRGEETEEFSNRDKFSLNITQIDKDETMFSNSIFSMKDFEGLREKDVEGGNVLKTLDNILGKSQQGLEMGDAAEFPLNESRKRRKRADRLKSTHQGSELC